MAFVVAAILMTLGVAALMLPRKSAHAERQRPVRVPTGPAAVEIASKRARWASVAVLASAVYQDIVLYAIKGPFYAGEGTPVIGWDSIPYAVSALFGLATSILYLMWFHRAVANTVILRAPIPWAPGQAVAAYFIPMVSFFRPYQVMKALHAASDPSALQDAPSSAINPRRATGKPSASRLPPLRWDYPAPIAAWWAVFNLRWVLAVFADGFREARGNSAPIAGDGPRRRRPLRAHRP